MKFSTNFKETSFWLNPPLPAKSFTTNFPPAKTDVLVIGGGYTGTTAAIRLRQAGTQFALIEMGKLATTASARIGRMTLAGLSEGLATIETKLGKEKVKQLFADYADYQTPYRCHHPW